MRVLILRSRFAPKVEDECRHLWWPSKRNEGIDNSSMVPKMQETPSSICLVRGVVRLDCDLQGEAHWA